MPPAVVFSPIFLDQKFPRTVEELRAVQVGLSKVSNEFRNGGFVILFPEAFEQFLDATNVTWRESHVINGYLVDITNLLSQLLLKSPGVIRLRLPTDIVAEPHPAPRDCDGELVNCWRTETGRLLAIHDLECNSQGYFVGILCPYRCANAVGGDYDAELPERHFRLVGIDGIGSTLADAYTYNVPQTVHDRRLTVREIEQNYRAIGGINIQSGKGDHRKIIFGNGRSWAFDSCGGRGGTPIPNKAFGQLEKVTGIPALAVKASLMDGVPVQERFKFRLHAYVLSMN